MSSSGTGARTRVVYCRPWRETGHLCEDDYTGERDGPSTYNLITTLASTTYLHNLHRWTGHFPAMEPLKEY